MFPPNLQKNIRELDRQISLLETECENMEAEQKEPGVGRESDMGKGLAGAAKPGAWPCCKGHESWVPSVEAPSTGNPEGTGAMTRGLTPTHIVHREVVIAKPGGTIEVTVTQKSVRGREENGEKRSPSNRSIGSIREMPEASSDESTRGTGSRSKLHAITSPGDHLAGGNSEIADCSTCRWATSRAEKERVIDALSKQTSSDDDCGRRQACDTRSRKVGDKKWLGLNEHSVSVDHVSVKKNWRPRSVRTRKKCERDIPVDVNIKRQLREKEIQCALWREEQEKEDFLLNLNDSIRTLHFLIAELKKKSICREKRGDVLNDIQTTLRKIEGGGAPDFGPGGSPTSLAPFHTGNPNHTPREGDDNMRDLKRAFSGVKQFCDQLSDEKSLLTEELTLRNRTISAMRTKEKEYLSLISTLKFNLERAREQANEWDRSQKELLAVRNKLEEETKVIEALKRSHAKMQDLVENYVLENDQLRTQMRLAKLESHKYNILLAGKEDEIKKYKQEMGSFQRQICEQLNMLRSKASENQVENAIKAITKQTGFISQTEVESLQSETNDVSDRESHSSSKSTLGSSWGRSQSHGSAHRVPTPRTKAATTASGRDGGYTSCRSDEFDPGLGTAGRVPIDAHESRPVCPSTSTEATSGSGSKT